MLEEKLRKALHLEHPYPAFKRRRLLVEMNPETQLIPSAVLVLFVFVKSIPYLIYIRRTETVENHKGQISFPGGVTEEDDQGNPIKTALRETWEEIGIQPELVTVIDRLPPLATVTGFEIHPVVGILNFPSYQSFPDLNLNQNEVEEILWIPFESLLHPDTYQEEQKLHSGESYPIDVFQVSGHRIWGATATITKNLLDRLNQVS